METGIVALKPMIAIVFLLVYLGLMLFGHKRPHIVWGAIGILWITLTLIAFSDNPVDGFITVGVEFFNAISWNVLAIFTGMSIIANLFIKSRVPAWLADWLIMRSKTAGAAMLWLCALASGISAFVDNVATILIVAPIALAIAKRLKASPVPLLIGIAISSNLQGTATLIGDPPSMIAGSFISQQGAKFGFNEFFVFQGKPGIFFAVQTGAVLGFLVLYYFFRNYRQPVKALMPVRIQSLFPTVILLSVIASLAVSTRFDPTFSYFGGTACVIGATIGLIWQYFDKSTKADGTLSDNGYKSNLVTLRRFDPETPIFLAGIFILVSLVEKSGMIMDIAGLIQRLFGDNLFLTYTMLVWISVILSGFIDNIPYIMVMLPVAAELGARLGGANGSAFYLLAFGLLIGACLGGNCTPIGASANVVSLGLLKKEGHSVGFGEFMKIGIPFTLAATFAGYLFLWVVWR